MTNRDYLSDWFYQLLKKNNGPQTWDGLKHDVYYNGENLSELLSSCLPHFYMSDKEYEECYDDMINELIKRTANVIFQKGGDNNGEKS